MREARMRTTVVALLVLLAAACGSAGEAAPASPAPSATAGVADRRTGTLGGDAQLEGGCVWLETDDGTRVEVLWPDGYRATADPVELRDDTGAVVAREGDRLVVRGAAAGDRVSVCQVGEIWRATAVEAAG